ncbi:Protein CBG01249 [Caenorhabditis briggsae]|uniref:Protein CBG01249 n=1 Tax=Caenorhabditis briggsae TaxID=6238 RepID=A8WPY3_CAEBR|nr:Protein CBG01249 [Caenorhabditis briggsae]CAP22541.2 Protein CBG01249 [Caenorhabditis briggsae]
MPARTTPDLESQVSQSSALVIPPPYMDPAHAQAKKLQSRLSRESISQMKPCEHCGAAPNAQVAHLPREQGWFREGYNFLNVFFSVFVWPAVRPTNHIHQDSRKFIGYVILIAFVIFLLFAACKYLP